MRMINENWMMYAHRLLFHIMLLQLILYPHIHQQQSIQKSFTLNLQLFFFIANKENYTNMATSSSSQSQPSYPHTSYSKPNFQATNQQILDEQTAANIMKKLAATMIITQGQDFQTCLKSLNTLFSKGYSHLFMTYDNLMRKLMNHFTRLGKTIQENSSGGDIESRMIFVLSLIAELLKENPKFYYPFTRKFLITVFTIDDELLANSPFKNNIMAILGVIYENFSRQPKLIRKYSMEENLKSSLLRSYYLIEEVFTMKTFNKTIVNLVNKKIYFSVAEMKKYQLVQTVSKFISQKQLELFMVKMNLGLMQTIKGK